MSSLHSSSSSSSSSYSLASTSLSNRLETIFNKASELSILCGIEVCVIYYGPDGELKTWPEEKGKVRDMALRYSQLNEALRRKKSVDLYGFLNKKKGKTMSLINKKRKTSFKKIKANKDLKYPISDHYSPDQISQLVQYLELNISKYQQRLRFVESQKQNLKPPPSTLSTQSLNPSQFSLFMYNHEDNTLSRVPISASSLSQDFSALLQGPGLKNQLMHKEFCGYDQNMCMSDITNNNNFQRLPCVSNTEQYSAVQQECVNNYELNHQLMQNYELYGYDQNMWKSDI